MKIRNILSAAAMVATLSASAEGMQYVLSADAALQKKEKIYFSLYDDIEKAIIDVANDFFDNIFGDFFKKSS